MEKIQLTQEQERALKEAWQEKGKANLINYHSLTEYDNNWASLGQLSTDDIARALYIGYEVIPQFKVGDWLFISKEATHTGKDQIRKIVDVCGNTIELEGHWYIGINSVYIRHATPEKIQQEKKRRFWDKLGREVDEYRVDDFIVDAEGDYGFITSKVDSEEYATIDYINSDFQLDKIHVRSLRLVVPAEKRLDK